MARAALHRGAQLAERNRPRLGGLADDRRNPVREGGREPETAPAAPASSPAKISASGPTNTSRPSIRYGAKRSKGASDTLSPDRLGARCRSSCTTSSGTA